MLFRTSKGELVDVKKYNFTNDKLYYQKIMEIKKPIIEPLNTLMSFAKLEKTFK